MKGRIFYSYLLALLCLMGLATSGFGQTITNVTFSKATVCAGEGLTVSFTTSTSFAVGNVFTAYLSDVVGGTYPTILGTLTSRTGGNISGTIPSTAANGNSYRIQIAAGNATKATSLSTLTINVPTAPGIPSPSLTYCEGNSPQSLIATASGGGTLNWYGQNPSGTPSSTATKPNTNLIGSTLYYVSQTVNGCESPKATITVTVKDTPAAPGTSPISYCVGQTASSLVATPVGSATLNWYGTSSNSGTASSISPVPSTTAVGPTTYYVSQTLSGCEGPRASLVVTVSSPPNPPTVTKPADYCDGDTPQSLNATASAGGVLNWYGTASSGGTASTVATQPNTSLIGPTNYYVSQTVNGCESSRATITVTVKSKPGLPATTPAPTYCQSQPAVALSATASTSAVLNWYGTSANGGIASNVATTPTTSQSGVTNYYVSQTLNGCESSRVAIAVTVKATPAAPTVTSPVIACQTRSTDPLSATPSSGGTLIWYGTASAGGTASSVAPTLSTINTGSTTYYVSQSVNGCESLRAALTVTVNAIPPAPSGQSVTYCEGATPQALVATGSLLKWYGTNSTDGTASTNATIPSTAASAIYYVTQTISGCESSRTGIPVVVKSKPAAPGTTNVELCQGVASLTLTATASASAVLNWYGTLVNGGTASSNPPVVSSATPGNTPYYVSQTLNGCESPRAGLSVRVKSLPLAPVVSAISFCNNVTAQPLTATGSNLKWYDDTDKLLTGPPTPNTSSLGNQVYKVSQTVDNCEGPKATLTVTINSVPTPPTGTSPSAYCEGTTAQALTAVGQNLKWYGTNATNGTGSSNATVPSTAASAIGSVTYYVTQTVNGCESARAGIPVQVKDTPAAPGTSGIDFCQNYTAPVLTASLVTNATANWYGTSANGGTASTNAPTPANSTVGTTVYYVSQTLSGCEGPRASLSVRVKTTPGAPSVNPVSFCNNATAQPLTANGTNLKWYDASDNSLAGTPTPNTGSVGNQTYKVSQTSSEGCEGPKATITVVINALPSQPTVAPVTYCQTQQDQPAQNVTSLQSNVSGQNLRWYNTDGNQFPNAPIPSVDKAGTQTFKVSQTVNNCESPRADLIVTINTVAAPITPKPVVVYCINDNATPLEAVGESGSQLRWIDPYGRVTTYAPTPATTNTNVQPGGDPFYVYQIGANGCYSPRTLIKAVVTSPPTLGLTAPTTTVNLGQRAPLQLKFTSSGPFTYTLTGGYTGTSTKTDTTISVLPRGNTIYQVITVSNGCGVGLPGSPATAQINVIVPTVSTSSIATTTLCTGTSLAVPFTTSGLFNSGNVFRIELVSAIDTTKKYAVSTTATSSPVTGTLPSTLPGGQYLVRIKADNPEIAIIGSNSPTQLTVRSVASATLTGSQTIYEGTPANLTLTFGGDAPWTTTYSDSLNNYSITTSTNPYIFEARPIKTTSYRLTNVTNVCGSGPISGTATIVVSPLLATDDNPLDPLIKTYPVPTQTILRVELELPLTHTPATLSLIDAGGRPVLENSTRKQINELDLTTQPNGLYFLRIQVGDRQTVRKIVKQ
ncbi:Ig-like domain-containing protein [Spirosoma foliorum]|nr:T9SS type A sorting domain-containing protein [Spirosoma foliorum]